MAEETQNTIFYAVTSPSGAHIGLWKDREQAERAVAVYDNSTITELVTLDTQLESLLSEPTHLHLKRGSQYHKVAVGKMQSDYWIEADSVDMPSVDMREVTIYRDIDDGSWWVRPIEEFEDDRRFKYLGDYAGFEQEKTGNGSAATQPSHVFQPQSEAPLTATQLADALDAFWNAAIGAAHNKQDTTTGMIMGCMAEGVQAVANELRSGRFVKSEGTRVSGDDSENPSAPGITLDVEDFHLLNNLKRDNVAGASRPVVSEKGDWEQLFRLSKAGLIAIEQCFDGGRLHITHRGMKTLNDVIYQHPDILGEPVTKETVLGNSDEL